MELTRAQIRKFQMIYEEHFSVALSEDEAKDKGLQVIRLMQQVYKPIPKKKLNLSGVGRKQ